MITRVSREAYEEHHEGRERWLAWDTDGRVAGVMEPWPRPDGKLVLYFDGCAGDAYAALAGAVPGEVHAMVPEAAAEHLRGCGFEPTRRELTLRAPVSRFDAPLPDGIRLASAADVPLEPLMLLDCALRSDVPGASGWQPDPVWFREETYDSPYFDPTTYLRVPRPAAVARRHGPRRRGRAAAPGLD